MKAKLIIEDKEFEIDINNFEKLIKPEKKTGYEKVKSARAYFSIYTSGRIDAFTCTESDYDNQVYEGANYYSDRTIAENNARADKLMRQLRRFAVEHRKEEIGWNDYKKRKWKIYFNYSEKVFVINYCLSVRDLFSIYFDSEEAAKLAIETFRDELIWYFTEYKDSL